MRLFSFSTKWTVFLVIGILAIFFRTYSLHGGPFMMFRDSETMARELIDREMRGQIGSALEKKVPGISDADKKSWVDHQLRNLSEIGGDERYEAAVRRSEDLIERVRKENWLGPRYLLEADPYHYLYQVEKILTDGFLTENFRSGRYFHPLMRAPHGHWGEALLHPYVGVFTYRLFQWFDPDVSLVRALGFVPLGLILLILIGYGVLGKSFGLGWKENAFGMATLVLSPIFIQRSALGWFDTDPYNCLFPILILSCVMQSFRQPRYFWAGVWGAGFLTAFYGFFWNGWLFIFPLVLASILVSTVFLVLLRRSQSRALARATCRFAALYLMISGLFLLIFWSPERLSGMLRMAATLLKQFALADFDIWPNVFLTVGEAGGITLKKLVFLTGNYVTFAVAFAGVLLEGWKSFRRDDIFRQFRYLFLLIFSLPLFFISLKTERFSLLFVLPLSLFVSFGVARIVDLADNWWRRAGISRHPDRNFARRLATYLLFLAGFLPLMLLTAHVVARNITPIMDDVWNAAMTDLREKTPHDAIINSWWPPGHFITGVARRRVTVDGGSQHFHVTYWMARALMAENEREAAGIFRMLNLSGEEALLFLTEGGMEVPDAVDLLLKIVCLGRDEASLELPSSMTEEQKESLLDLTHGRGELPPSYVLVYDDLITQNLAVSTMAQWDFRKAMEIREKRRARSPGPLGFFDKNAVAGYMRDFLRVSGEFAKYTAAAKLDRREGSLLLFSNGVAVNLASQDAFIFLPAKKSRVRPASLFYLDGNRLVEKIYPDKGIEASALYFEEEGAFYCVIADARLIRSLLFRLYYLRAQGLDYFKPFAGKGTLEKGTVVRIFELNRGRFLDG